MTGWRQMGEEFFTDVFDLWAPLRKIPANQHGEHWDRAFPTGTWMLHPERFPLRYQLETPAQKGLPCQMMCNSPKSYLHSSSRLFMLFPTLGCFSEMAPQLTGLPCHTSLYCIALLNLAIDWGQYLVHRPTLAWHHPGRMVDLQWIINRLWLMSQPTSPHNPSRLRSCSEYPILEYYSSSIQAVGSPHRDSIECSQHPQSHLSGLSGTMLLNITCLIKLH